MSASAPTVVDHWVARLAIESCWRGGAETPFHSLGGSIRFARTRFRGYRDHFV